MRRIIIAVIVCLTLSVFGVQTSKAEEIKECVGEPTDQGIQYGDFLDGSNCRISPVGERDIFRFQGRINEQIIFQATDQSGYPTYQQACITLLGPDGIPTENGARTCAGLTARIEETLEEDGEHTIIVEEGIGREMPYGLAIDRVAPTFSPNTPSLCFGCNIEDVIDGVGDMDLYLIDGASGDRIIVQATDQSGYPGYQQACITLFGPDGMPTANGARTCAGLTARIEETLQENGVHAILVEEGTGREMPYLTDLQCLNPPCGSNIGGTELSLVTGDLDGDGDDDLAGINASGKIWYTTNLTSWTSIPGTLERIVTGDLDGDGDDDLAGINASGKIWYTTNLTSWTSIPGTLEQLVTGDLDGDGDDDLAGINASGKIWYTTNLTSWTSIPGTLEQIVTGNLDGDGDDDLAGINASGKIWYTTNLTSWTNIPGTLEQIVTGNLDGDGDVDIVALNAIGKVGYTTNLTSWTNIPGTLKQIAIGNLAGDSNDDIAGVNAIGKVWYTSNLTSWTNIPGTLKQIATGDLDGDRDDDIVGTNAIGKVWYTVDLSTWNSIPLP